MVANYCGVVLLVVMSLAGNCARSLEVENKDYLYPVKHLLNNRGQVDVVKGLLDRLLPNRSSEFNLIIDPQLGPVGKDTFEFISVGKNIQVTGTSAIALSMGINHYLKYYCNVHVSWSGDQLNLATPLPNIPKKIRITSNDGFRYYQNVCTVSYSMVWWDWKRWEREIDWMALNGINLPLAFTAQEAIWHRVYIKLGFNDSQINEFFTGPAFLAWNRMGNMQGFAGPLSQSWHQKRIILQKQILLRMREFGIVPVLPAFAGRVPPSFAQLFPNSTVSKDQTHWGHFDEPYCCTSFIEPDDPMFRKIGTMFLKEYISEFGTDHMYNTDLFNELDPPYKDPDFLRKCGKAVFESLTDADPDAVWLMQGWIFVNSPTFWQPEQTKALLTSVPLGRMVILDLEAEFFPQYQRFESYYGQPFIWCMLHNFGGVYGLYGALSVVNEGTFPARTYPNSTMIGTGLTPEGIEKNYVMYEFMNEMAWRTEPADLDEWLTAYATRRYGKTDQNITDAWKLLKSSVYNAPKNVINHGGYVMVLRPSLKRVPLTWYDTNDVAKALELFFQAAKSDPTLQNQETFKYDLIDVSRQFLQVTFDINYLLLVESFHTKNLTSVRKYSSAILKILDLLEKVLSTDKQFSLHKWIESARSWASTPEEVLQFEYNARNQISLWGPTGQIIDYANKQWSGVVSGLYKPRWSLFCAALERNLMKKIPYNQTEFDNMVLWFVEEPFTFAVEEDVPHYTTDDWFSVVSNVVNKCKPLFLEHKKKSPLQKSKNCSVQ